jgi:5-methylcytosine-specific restriction protein A
MSLARLARVVHSVARAAVHRLRSSRWRAVERAHLKAEPKCGACGGKRLLQVHHVIAFEARPELELEPTNLLTLCMSGVGDRECHLKLGHGGNFRFYNPRVRTHAALALGGDVADAEVLARRVRIPIASGLGRS